MIRPLLSKELREHRWVLVALWVVGALMLLGLVHQAADEGSPLVAYLGWTRAFGTLAVLTLTNRLVVREYSGRTQLFLETLPVGRGQVTAVKWLLGATLLLVTMAVGFAATLHVAASQVQLSARFVELMAWRSGTFLLFAYALAFLVALTGRYRYALWAALLIGAFITDSRAQLPIEQWPPLHLIAQSMVFERVQLPLRDLVITGLATILLVAASFTLVLAGEGSLVVRLSQRMAPREKVGVIIALIAVMALLDQLDERKPKPPFELLDAVTSDSGGAHVAIERTAGGARDTARDLADLIASDLEQLKPYLSLSELPGVSVLPDASIDADVYQRAALPGSDGVVLRAAINAGPFEPEQFRAYALEQTLAWYTHERGLAEQRRWLLDGFTQWWIARAIPARRERLALRAALAAQVLQATGDNVSGGLQHWLVAREQLGDCLGDALAWRAVTRLADTLGPERFRGLMGALWGKHLPDDARAALLEPSLEAAWRRAGAPTLPQLGVALQADLQADRGGLDPQLATRLRLPVNFAAVRMTGTTYEVHYRLGNPGSDSGPFAVRYKELGPWEAEIGREQLARVDATRAGVLPRSFAAGTRLFSAIELHDAQASCTLRLGARRWELR